jgi:HEAT repeat protein
MRDLLSAFRLDPISFWLGFLAGLLFWLLARMLLPALKRASAAMRTQRRATRGEQIIAGEIRLKNDTMRQAQNSHLAAQLFSLEEVVTPPLLLAPPLTEKSDSAAASDITDWTIPYMPDWPELGSHYGAPSFSLAEALHNRAPIAVIGPPGSGKTVALAHLAIQILHNAPATAHLNRYVPLLVHAGDLLLPIDQPGQSSSGENEPIAIDVLSVLTNAIAMYAAPKTVSQLPKTLSTLFEQERAFLLVDGLDELPPAQIDSLVSFLGFLLQQYPHLRLAVAASADYLGGLIKLGFFPLALTTWTADQRAAFLTRWRQLWEQHISNSDSSELAPGNPLLLSGWLLNNTTHISPLELTLVAWAAYAGDAIGPLPSHAIEAHIRRLTHNQPARNRHALEHLAYQMALSMQPVADLRSIEKWTPDSSPAQSTDAEPAASEAPAAAHSPKARVKLSGAIPNLIDCGLIVNRAGDRASICHLVFTAYLAGLALSPLRAGDQIAMQPAWSGRAAVLHFLSSEDPQPSYLSTFLQDETTDPILSNLLSAARWLRSAPEKLPWVAQVMRALVGALQKDNLPFGLKTRILTSLLLSGNSGLPVLLRQMIQSPRSDLCHLAALGIGFLADRKSVSDLANFIHDPSPGILQAALLALVSIGDKIALESAAEVLLHGSENARRAAAEALSNHVEEGHPTLQEASTVGDPLVRRASIFGLARLKQPWATQIIEGLRTEDKQWVVQDIANQALAVLEHPHPRIPKPLPALTMAPWLISFAAEHGVGVAPGKPAQDLMIVALHDGKPEQRLAALHYMTYQADKNTILPLYQAFFSGDSEIEQAALNALWHCAASGISLPPPMQYGMK